MTFDEKRARDLCDWVDRLAPGPWSAEWTNDDGDEESAGIDEIVDAKGDSVVIADSGVYPPHGKVACFIVESRTLLPAALDEIARLRGCLKKANDNHEEYERRWYLEQDTNEKLRSMLTQALERLEDTGIYPTKWKAWSDEIRREIEGAK